MALALASEVARIAKGLLDGPEIPYKIGGLTPKAMDCQGLVKYCIREAGGAITQTGSNTMWRECCSWKGTLAEAKKQGKMVPGAIVFMKEPTDKDLPAKYKSDGEGDFSHIGVYVGAGKNIHSVDASASAGKVRARNDRDAPYVWTHVGWFNAIDYVASLPRAGQAPPVNPPQGAVGRGTEVPLPGAIATGKGITVKKPAKEPQEEQDVTLDDPDDVEVYTVDKADVVEPSRPGPVFEDTPRRVLPRQLRVHTPEPRPGETGRLKLRAQPHMNGAYLGGIERGEIVDVLDGMGGWYQVRAPINGKWYTGWASADHLRNV